MLFWRGRETVGYIVRGKGILTTVFEDTMKGKAEEGGRN